MEYCIKHLQNGAPNKLELNIRKISHQTKIIKKWLTRVIVTLYF